MKKIDHIGIAVHSLDKAISTYRMLGLEASHIEMVPDMKVRVAFIPVGESRFELLEPQSQDSVIAKFLQKRGEGIHHICIEVSNILKTLKDFKAKNVNVVYESPQRGAENSLVSFIHPNSTHGLLLEICQKQR